MAALTARCMPTKCYLHLKCECHLPQVLCVGAGEGARLPRGAGGDRGCPQALSPGALTAMHCLPHAFTVIAATFYSLMCIRIDMPSGAALRCGAQHGACSGALGPEIWRGSRGEAQRECRWGGQRSAVGGAQAEHAGAVAYPHAPRSAHMTSRGDRLNRFSWCMEGSGGVALAPH